MKPRVLIALAALGIFCTGAFAGIWAQAFFMPYLASHASFQNWGFVQDWINRAPVIREISEVVIRVDDAAERTAARAEGMVAGIESRSAGNVTEGSGFVITSDGFILTLASAVPQGHETRVYLQDAQRSFSAEVLKRDFDLNLAVLKIEGRNLPTAGFASADSLRLGAPVVMVAKSLEAGELVTIVNQGTVRAKSEAMVRTNMFDKSALGGSPLFNLEGNIVGLNTFEASGRLVAVPASVLRSFSGF